MKQFGGNWTKIKIKILVEYANAYLTIMNTRKYFKTLYFDGFAGSGFIVKDSKFGIDVTIGAARRILEISHPKPFDVYYFVEKDPKTFKLLKENTKDAFPEKEIYTVSGDCNKKILDLSKFLSKKENAHYRTLAYIDPCGMQLEWNAIESLRELPVDLWVLVPTGLGVNRLLETDGDISDSWLERLEKFLGLSRMEVKKYFYVEIPSLFNDITRSEKEVNAIGKAAKLYQSRLKEVFKFVSNPYELKNSRRSPMYHLYLASNNRTAVNIGNDIVKKYKNQYGATIINRVD
ncbi:MAG: three-Cys-motif partner protein TcmP [Ignavibacteriae bacterium]|nr:three-Cys-motif partner protein TcmP [Ignavibacteriota bacterium]